MKIIDTITLTELRPMVERMYGTMVKADVDVAKKVVVIDMDMHADGEAYLLEYGSQQTDLWGINLYLNRCTSKEVRILSRLTLSPTCK